MNDIFIFKRDGYGTEHRNIDPRVIRVEVICQQTNKKDLQRDQVKQRSHFIHLRKRYTEKDFEKLCDNLNKCINNQPVGLEDLKLKQFLRYFSRKLIKSAILRSYLGSLIKKRDSTDYAKHKWEKEGHLQITEADVCKYWERRWKCT